MAVEIVDSLSIELKHFLVSNDEPQGISLPFFQSYATLMPKWKVGWFWFEPEHMCSNEMYAIFVGKYEIRQLIAFAYTSFPKEYT